MIVFPIAAQPIEDSTTETEAEGTSPRVMREPRIVGGKSAFIGQFPYQVVPLLSNQTYM
jgi:hypothetical protein